MSKKLWAVQIVLGSVFKKNILNIVINIAYKYNINKKLDQEEKTKKITWIYFTDEYWF